MFVGASSWIGRVLIAVLILGFGSCAGYRRGTNTNYKTITGVVEDNGSGVSGVEVTAQESQTSTGSSGEFILSVVSEPGVELFLTFRNEELETTLSLGQIPAEVTVIQLLVESDEELGAFRIVEIDLGLDQGEESDSSSAPVSEPIMSDGDNQPEHDFSSKPKSSGKDVDHAGEDEIPPPPQHGGALVVDQIDEPSYETGFEGGESGATLQPAPAKGEDPTAPSAPESGADEEASGSPVNPEGSAPNGGSFASGPL